MHASLLTALIGLLITLASPLCLAAQEAPDASIIGYVKTVQGDAQVLSGGKAVAAKPGTPLALGDVLRTGSKSSMGVTFRDNTVMSFGPDTQLTIDDYLYAPSKGELKLGASMAHGTMQYISGVIAKLKPEAVTVKTPTGNIGVRGTHFLVKVDAEK